MDQVHGQRMPRDPRYQWLRLQIFLVTWLGYAGLYLTRKSFSVAKVGLKEDPDILMSPEQMSLIDGAYLTAYAIGQFLWGISADKVGTRRIILVGLLASVMVGFAAGASSLVMLFAVFLFIQGLCQSTGWAPLAKNVSNWFSQHERGIVMGWWCTNYAVGGAVASPFAGISADYISKWIQRGIGVVSADGPSAFFMQDWRYAFFIPAATLLVIWVLFLFLQKNKPEDAGLPSIEKYHGESEAVLVEGERPEEDIEGSWSTIFKVIRNPMILRLGLVYFLLKPTRYAILFWAPYYVSEKLGSGMAKSGLISILFEVTGPIAVLLGGVASDKLFQSRRMPPSVICLFLLAAVLFPFNIIVDQAPSAMLIGSLLAAVGFFLFIPDSLISGTAAVDFGTKKGASTASGFINGCGSIGAVLGGTLPGLLHERFGWTAVFIVLGSLVLLAAIVLSFKWNAVPPTANNTAAGGLSTDQE